VIAALASQRVLICEDEGITIMQLKRAVAVAGLVLIGISSSAAGALEVALRDRPEVILYDIRLPGLDGMEVVRQLVEAYQPCIIAMVAQSDEAAAALSAGAAASIMKPADTADLLNALPECVKRYTHAVVNDSQPARDEPTRKE
jgi:two-component system nitrogen regulation response regulator GlnG